MITAMFIADADTSQDVTIGVIHNPRDSTSAKPFKYVTAYYWRNDQSPGEITWSHDELNGNVLWTVSKFVDVLLKSGYTTDHIKFLKSVTDWSQDE